jgi:hypothetical protein
MQPSDMNPLRMRVVEPLDNGDKIITYFDIINIDEKFYYVYNDVNHGPFEEIDDAVQAATKDLVLDNQL